MALFGKKSKDLGPGVIITEDEILGHMDEIFRQRGTITVRTKDKYWQCSLYFVDVKRKLLRIEDSSGLSENNDKPVQCGYTLDGTWFVFQSKLLYSDGKPHILMPSAIKHHDRRRSPRVNISPRENVRVSVLQSLGAGIGITGLAANVTVDGLCIKIERAINLQNEQPVTLRYDTLPEGTELMIVKVNHIPTVPSFESTAIVKWVSPGAGGKLAVQFPKLPGSIKTYIENFIQSRYLPSRPVKRSYQRRQEIEREKEIDRQREEIQQTAQENEPAKPTAKPADRPTNKPTDRQTDKPADKQGPVIFVPEESPQAETGTNEAEVPVMRTFSPDIKETLLPDLADLAPDEEEEIEEALQPILLSLGDELKESLSFLEGLDKYDWIHAESPMRVIKFLRERKCDFLFLPPEYKQQSMLEYLEKMSGMGILSEVGIILLSTEQLSPKDLIKCRMLGIEHTLRLPLESPEQILGIISAADSGPR